MLRSSFIYFYLNNKQNHRRIAYGTVVKTRGLFYDNIWPHGVNSITILLNEMYNMFDNFAFNIENMTLRNKTFRQKMFKCKQHLIKDKKKQLYFGDWHRPFSDQDQRTE